MLWTLTGVFVGLLWSRIGAGASAGGRRCADEVENLRVRLVHATPRQHGTDPKPGRALVSAINERLAEANASGIAVRGVECLAVCKRPCTIAMIGAGKWTYVIGDLEPALHVGEIVDAAVAFQRSPNGIVPWGERPDPVPQGRHRAHPAAGLRATRDGERMTSIAKVPCTIVTGFLGAGKTTLVRHMLQNAGGRRLAVIVNEFGDVGIDGEILKGCGVETCSEDRIVELSNGCICCTVADDFVPALGEPARRSTNPPEHILIETSGLALPKPLVQAFNWPAIASRVTVDGVIAVVDGAAVAAGRFADDPDALAAQRADDASLDHDNPLEEVYEDQLLCADLIVLNKTDLHERRRAPARHRGDQGGRAARGEGGRGRRRASSTPRCCWASAPRRKAISPRGPRITTPRKEHDHDDFESFIVDIPAVAEPAEALARIGSATAAHDILRIKGFADVTGKPMRLLIQGVGQRAAAPVRPRLAPGESRAGPARRDRPEGPRSRRHRPRDSGA